MYLRIHPLSLMISEKRKRIEKIKRINKNNDKHEETDHAKLKA